MIYQSYSVMRKAIFFFIGIKFCKMETKIFPEKLNFHELMIEIFLDYRHIQLHNKAFAKIYSCVHPLNFSRGISVTNDVLLQRQLFT